MSEVAEHIVDDAVTETQESTGTISGKEFGDQVERRVEETTDALQDEFGEAANELVGETTSTVKGYRQQLTEMVGDNNVGDTEEEGAAGYVVRDSKEMVLSKRHTDRKIDNKAYRDGVLRHETVHKDDQATSYTSQTIKALDDDTGKIVEVSVVGDMTERHAIRRAGQSDGDLVPEYVQHREKGDIVADIVGESRFDQAMSSGDTAALQKEIIEKQRKQLFAHLQQSGTLPGENN